MFSRRNSSSTSILLSQCHCPSSASLLYRSGVSGNNNNNNNKLQSTINNRAIELLNKLFNSSSFNSSSYYYSSTSSLNIITLRDVVLDGPRLYNIILRNYAMKLNLPVLNVVPALTPYPNDNSNDNNSFWKRFVEFYLPRHNKYYIEKKLPQEVAFLSVLDRIMCNNNNKAIRRVVDVGGGNGDLAHLIKCRWPFLDVCVVDRATPPHAETYSASTGGYAGGRFVRRFERDILMFSFEELNNNYKNNNINSHETLFIAKHLCGTAIDNLLFTNPMCTAGGLGAGYVIAPCCHHKGSGEHFLATETSGVLREILLLNNDDDILLMRSLTSWGDLKNGTVMSWRWIVGKLCQALIDMSRLALLKQKQKHHAVVELTSFVPREVTP
eukprot:PhM_4_TR8852/c0_g1_i1/m.4769